jgi:hypothetical protein
VKKFIRFFGVRESATFNKYVSVNTLFFRKQRTP